jgi:phosphatidylserine/phosphatidylglycerophosphate/cardiolipin synthase-like enzyme
MQLLKILIGTLWPRKIVQSGKLKQLSVIAMRFIGALIFFCCFAFAQPSVTPLISNQPISWQVYFSPGGEATYAICRALSSAKITVLVQAYSFTSAPIAQALVKAQKRGVKVQVILDRSQKTQKYSSADFLNNSGIPTRIDAAHAIAHNKVMIIDGQIVITGSFNFTRAAEDRNAENLIIIPSRELADQYAKNWRLHQSHSEPYGRNHEVFPTTAGHARSGK